MRIEKLDLLAFGPFTRASLDFTGSRKAVRVIYGSNEAGKSTTLRAITQLLYGIPHQSPDAYLHEGKELRIAATLLDEAGKRHRFIRRKGRVHTLLDSDGEPIDDAPLLRLLNGTPESLFTRMFGLDHEQLRKGAEALLSGGGDLGESLFDAGVGGAPVHDVLRELRSEAEAIYKPRGRTPLLNAALERARASSEQRRTAALAPEKWQEQQKALQEATERHRTLSERRATWMAEQARLQRAIKVLPALRQWDRAVAEREGLGAVRLLDADAPARRVQAEQTLTNSERELAYHTGEAALRRSELDALGTAPERPLGEQVTLQLREGFGAYRRTASELPALEQRMRELHASCEGFQAALPQGARERFGDRVQLPADLQARIGELSATRKQATELLAQRRQQQQDDADALAALRKRRDDDDAPTDVGPLKALLDDPRAQLDTTALSDARAEIDVDLQRVVRGLAELGLGIQLATLVQLALPAQEQLAELRAQAQALDTRRERWLERRAALQAEHAEIVARRETLVAQGEVPDESVLRAAREARDASFAPLASALEKGQTASAAQLESFDQGLREADHVADRLWREADRVQRNAELRGRSTRHEAQSTTLADEHAAWERDAQAHETQLRAALGDAFPEGLSMREAERRVERARTLQGEAERAAHKAQLLDAREASAREFLERLRRALSPTDEAGAANEPLGNLGRYVAEARRRVQDAQERLAHARALREAIESAERNLARAEERAREAEASLAERDTRFREQARELGLGDDASEEEVLGCLRVLRDLQERQTELRALGARIDREHEAQASFERQVAELCETHLGEAPTDAAEGVDRLQERSQSERDRAVGRAHLNKSLEEHLERERRARAERDGSREALAKLCARAGVESEDALPEAELRSEQARLLDARLLELRNELLEAGEGADVAELRALVEGVEMEAARARLAALADELEALQEELDDAKQQELRLQLGLEQYQRSTGAADVAELHESQLSEVLALSRQYLVQRVAERILQGEVERYREANQGPLLKRASELVAPLTLGRYERLSVDYEREDRPRLSMVRSDGKTVPVEAMSDGTRDTLYLALKLSSLERFVDLNGEMPLVLDDCFVHFDDERARAAIRVLGDYARRTQVLLFTHHQRIVEIAESALGKAGVVTLDLDEARRQGEDRNDGPLFASR